MARERQAPAWRVTETKVRRHYTRQAGAWRSQGEEGDPMDASSEITGLVAGLSQISDDVGMKFGGLSAEQLNWKPSLESWSVGQCLDHLINSNRPYITIVDEALTGNRPTRAIERIPVLPGLFGKLLIKSLDPKSVRKLKAPSKFQPASSNVPGTIVSDFVKQQSEVAARMEAAKRLNPDRVIITSPALSVITYSMLDAFRVIVTHERRHFAQAERVIQNPHFPGAN